VWLVDVVVEGGLEGDRRYDGTLGIRRTYEAKSYRHHDKTRYGVSTATIGASSVG
jgi:hypothetical protein